ncbi:hypothetical protein BS78_09G251500 [Paspalum vaginatum]|nr:hypothetical protein BS78_09G251500 [Paspalum vaginatum]
MWQRAKRRGGRRSRRRRRRMGGDFIRVAELGVINKGRAGVGQRKPGTARCRIIGPPTERMRIHGPKTYVCLAWAVFLAATLALARAATGPPPALRSGRPDPVCAGAPLLRGFTAPRSGRHRFVAPQPLPVLDVAPAARRPLSSPARPPNRRCSCRALARQLLEI